MKKILITFVVVAFFFIGNNTALASGPYNDGPLAEIETAMNKIESAAFRGDMGLKGTVKESGDTYTFDIGLKAAGRALESLISPELDATFDFKVLLKMPYEGENITVRGSTQIATIFKNADFYFNVKKLAISPIKGAEAEMKEMNEMVKLIKNIWIKIGSEDLGFGQAMSTGDDIVSQIFNETKASQFSLAELEKLGIVTLTPTSSYSKVSSVQARKYKLNINKEKLVMYFVAKMEGSTIDELMNEISPAELAELRKVLNAFKIKTFDVWIDEETNLLMKTAWDASFKYADTYMAFSLTTKGQFTYSDYNKIKPIVAPLRFKTIEEMEALFPTTYSY